MVRNSKRYKADHYVKRFTAKDHLISMLFCGVYHDLLRGVRARDLGHPV
ncbi:MULTISPECIES: DUF4372 domain-containing protein [unclassified Proteiniphilum]